MALPALAEMGSSLIAGGLNFAGSHMANIANKQMAREQMKFQERMSNTQYQRARADMVAAGINPMAMMGLGGASSPSGASMQQQNELGGAVSSAIDMRRTIAELKNIEAQTKLKDAEAEITQAAVPAAKNQEAVANSMIGKIMPFIERVLPPSVIAGGSGYILRHLTHSRSNSAKSVKIPPGSLKKKIHPQKHRGFSVFRAVRGFR